MIRLGMGIGNPGPVKGILPSQIDSYHSLYGQEFYKEAQKTNRNSETPQYLRSKGDNEAQEAMFRKVRETARKRAVFLTKLKKRTVR